MAVGLAGVAGVHRLFYLRRGAQYAPQFDDEPPLAPRAQ